MRLRYHSTQKKFCRYFTNFSNFFQVLSDQDKGLGADLDAPDDAPVFENSARKGRKSAILQPREGGNIAASFEGVLMIKEVGQNFFKKI